MSAQSSRQHACPRPAAAPPVRPRQRDKRNTSGDRRCRDARRPPRDGSGHPPRVFLTLAVLGLSSRARRPAARRFTERTPTRGRSSALDRLPRDGRDPARRGAVGQAAARAAGAVRPGGAAVGPAPPRRSLTRRRAVRRPGRGQLLTGDRERGRVLDLPVRTRLVTTDDDTVVLAHEALISAWPRLRAWLDEDVAGARVARHLALAGEDWETGGWADGYLHRGARLDAARELATQTLTPSERTFLDASSALVAAEREAAEERRRVDVRHTRRLRRALVATAAVLVLALVAGAVAVERSVQAARHARAAQVDQLVAQSAALVPTRRDLAALLPVAAYRLRADAATRSAIFGVLTATPGFLPGAWGSSTRAAAASSGRYTGRRTSPATSSWTCWGRRPRRLRRLVRARAVGPHREAVAMERADGDRRVHRGHRRPRRPGGALRSPVGGGGCLRPRHRSSARRPSRPAARPAARPAREPDGPGPRASQRRRPRDGPLAARRVRTGHGARRAARCRRTVQPGRTAPARRRRLPLAVRAPGPRLSSTPERALVARLDGYHTATWSDSSDQVLAWSGALWGRAVGAETGRPGRRLRRGSGSHPRASPPQPRARGSWSGEEGRTRPTQCGTSPRASGCGPLSTGLAPDRSPHTRRAHRGALGRRPRAQERRRLRRPARRGPPLAALAISSDGLRAPACRNPSPQPGPQDR